MMKIFKRIFPLFCALFSTFWILVFEENGKTKYLVSGHEWTFVELRDLFIENELADLNVYIRCHPEIKIDTLFNIINLMKNSKISKIYLSLYNEQYTEVIQIPPFLKEDIKYYPHSRDYDKKILKRGRIKVEPDVEKLQTPNIKDEKK